jgi:ArsR family transcriptional regulator
MSAKAALLEEYALVARALSAPARLVILEQLAQGERAVEGLAAKTGLTVANCSQHLQQLRRAGLVTSRREGKAVIYRLTDPRTLALMDLLRLVAERNLAEVERILRGLSGGEDAPEPVSRADLAARLAEGSVTVLDVRPADEYAAGHIPGAVNVTLEGLDRILPSLAPGVEIVAYCRGPYCVYAYQAVAALRSRGLNARRMEGGLPEWREEGRIIETALDGA